jgi:hypothetical protein
MNHRTKSAIERQIAAMGADVLEVGLLKPRTPSDPHTEPEMLPRVWTARHCSGPYHGFIARTRMAGMSTSGRRVNVT